MRCVLALMFCGNRIFEVTTATLGPLPLDQLPKSKPVTPYAVLTIVPTGEDNANPALGDRSSLNTRSPIVIPSPRAPHALSNTTKRPKQPDPPAKRPI